MSSPRVYKTEGIILKRKNVGEADRIVTVFTKEYGKLRLIAKGIRKIASRRAPHLEVFTQVILMVHTGRSMESITEVTTLQAFESLRENLTRVSLAYYLCDLVDSLMPEKQEQEEIYDLLFHALSGLQTVEDAVLYSHSKAFTLELLWALGFLPRNKSLNGVRLQEFIETITERKLKSTYFAKLLMDAGRA